MTYAHKIIAAFGGVRALARRIDRPTSTVGSWVDRGSIPDPDKAVLLSLAQQDGLDLGPADFFPFEKMPAGAPDAADQSPPPTQEDAA